MDAREAWDVTRGSNSVLSAVLDTGVDATHVDFQGRTIIGDVGYGHPEEPYHGTHVMGIIGAATNNGQGVAGLDWNCQLMSQWLNPYTNDKLAEALYDATNGGADLANMSFGSTVSSETVRNAAHYAFLSGVSLFAAMGNDYGNVPIWPARYSEIITAVGATDRNDVKADFSNTGSWIDVVAPGVSIRSTEPGNLYVSGSGTSYSTPVACGVGGLLLAKQADLTDLDIEEILERTADDRGSSGFDESYGWGRISARQALDYLQQRVVAHQTIGPSGVYEVGHTGWYNIVWFYPPNGYPSGTYNVRRYELQADPTYSQSYQGTPDVWVRLGGTAGMSAANPHYYDFRWGSVVSANQTGCTLKTFVYEVRAYPQGTPLGWWPAAPNEVTFAFTAAGVSASSAAPEQHALDHQLAIRLDPNFSRPENLRGVMLDLPRAGMANVAVYDAVGRRLVTLHSGALEAGERWVPWDGRGQNGTMVAPGVYFVEARLRGLGRAVERIVVVR